MTSQLSVEDIWYTWYNWTQNIGHWLKCLGDIFEQVSSLRARQGFWITSFKIMNSDQNTFLTRLVSYLDS